MGGRWYGQEERVADRRGLVRGAQDAWGPWLAQLREWDLFATLTYDPKRLTACPSEWKFRRDVTYWLRDCGEELGRPVVGVVAMERQLNGWPHGHGLLDVGGLQKGDVERMGRLWFRRGERGLGGGYNRLEVPRSIGEVTEYCAKYVTKSDLEQLVIVGRLEQKRYQVGDVGVGTPIRKRRRSRAS